MTKLKKQDIELLTKIIKQWNSDRLDLFEISVPNEDGEFYGVMRFYFQEEGEKVATKCIRVTSTATAIQVINTLIEKFRPDMKLLTRSRYSLYEVHVNGDEKKIEDDEKPLLVQLNWNKDDREGRFLLKRENEKSKVGLGDSFYRETREKVKAPASNTFKRRLSSSSSKNNKHDKKDSSCKKQQQREASRLNESTNTTTSGVGDKLYAALPETCFTRSISNPEAVMRRRRAQKLEKKLRAINATGNGSILNGSINGLLPCPDKGGTVKIYGESLQAGVPYKTLLLAITDTAAYCVKETLIKYGITDVDPSGFCLYEVHCAGNYEAGCPKGPEVLREYALGDRECPIARLMQYQQDKDNVIFRIGRKQSAKNNELSKNWEPGSNQRTQNHGELPSPQSSPAKSFTSSHLSASTTVSNQRLNSVGVPKYPNSSGSVRLDESTVLYQVDDSSFFDQTLTNSTLHCPRDQAGPQHVKENGYPFLIELHNDGSDITERNPMVYHLASLVIEIGSDAPLDSGSLYLQLKGRDIYPKHCILTRTTHHVSLTPCRSDAAIWIDGKAIHESTVLKHGSLVRLGNAHTFRFYDPSMAETISKERKSSLSSSVFSDQRRPTGTNRLEETHLDDDHAHNPDTPSSNNALNTKHECQNFVEFVRKHESLPAFLDFILNKGEEGAIVDAIIPLDPSKQLHINLPFKLGPAYMVYLCVRNCILRDAYSKNITQSNGSPSMAMNLEIMLNKVVGHLKNMIETYKNNPVALTFWLTNSSEAWHALRKEQSLLGASPGPRPKVQRAGEHGLAQCVHSCFRHLTDRLKGDLCTVMINMFQPPPLTTPDTGSIGGSGDGPYCNTFEDVVVRPCAPLIKTLTSLMNMLKQHRLNASFTIQIFSRLFYFVNAWTFNAIFTGLPGDRAQGVGPVLEARTQNQEPNPYPPYSREWGSVLRARFGELERWSELNGLELAAECHLAKIIQLLQLLMMPKASLQDLPHIASNCGKLNSLQFYTALTHYRHEPGEPQIPNELTERIVSIAHSTTDEVLRTPDQAGTGGVVLEEALELSTPFIYPQDGYSYDVITNVPSALLDSVQMCLTDKGLAQLIVLPSQYGGAWNVHFKAPHKSEDFNLSPPTQNEISANGLLQSNGFEPVKREEINLKGVFSEPSGTCLNGIISPKNVTITKTERGLGLSILAASISSHNESLGIYVRAVVAGGAAELAGAPGPGDQLLAVNGISLVGVDEGTAARLMGQAGHSVTLTYIPSPNIFASGNTSPDYGVCEGKPESVNKNQMNSPLLPPPFKLTNYAATNGEYVTRKEHLSYGSQSSLGPSRSAHSHPTQVIASRNSPNHYPSLKNTTANSYEINYARGPSPGDSNGQYKAKHTGFPIPAPHDSPNIEPAAKVASAHAAGNAAATFQWNHNSSSIGSVQTNAAPRNLEKVSPYDGHRYETNHNITQSTLPRPYYTAQQMNGSHSNAPYGPTFDGKAFKVNQPPSPSPSQNVNIVENKNIQFGSAINVRSAALEADLYMGGNAYKASSSANILNHPDRDLYSSVKKTSQQHENGEKFEMRFPKLDKGLPEPVDIGPREKIAFCQDMIMELEGKEYQTPEDKERLKALMMEYEFQKRVLEDEEINQRELSEEDEDLSPKSPTQTNKNRMDYNKNGTHATQGTSSYTNGYVRGNDSPQSQPAKLDHGYQGYQNQQTYDESINSASYHGEMSYNQSYHYTQQNRGETLVEHKPKPPDRSLASFEAASVTRLRQTQWQPSPPPLPSNKDFSRAQQREPHIADIPRSPKLENGLDNLTYAEEYQDYNGESKAVNLPPPFGVQPNFHGEKYGLDKWLQSIDANMREGEDDKMGYYGATESGGMNGGSENMLVNTSTTPGVIGAQEIYLDPRVKLQMLKKQRQTLRDNLTSYPIQSILKKPKEVKESNYQTYQTYDKYNGFKESESLAATLTDKNGQDDFDDQNLKNGEKQASPERMSFREKMKKFAQVSGSQNPCLTAPIESGMEKLRISKTQKKIEDSLLT